MSVNPSYKFNAINYNTTTVDIQETTSILSDDQSSYILFNPINSESDILSLTNSTRTNQFENQSDQSNNHTAGNSLDDINQNTIHEDLHNSFDSLSHKINNWNLSEHASELVDDNIASWNLDENLSSSPILNKKFYGDELFKNFDKVEFNKFKKFHLRSKLTNNDKNLINQLLIKLLIKDSDLNSHNDITDGASSKTNDYLNNFSNGLEISDTNSSLVLCGGVGFGGTSSWNDI